MTEVYVSSSEELYAALAHAEAGQYILLESGTYDEIALWYGLGIDLDLSDVTIASADPLNPAVIHQFEAKGVSNLTLSNVLFDYIYQDGQPTYKRPFEFIDCTNISIEDVTFDGDIARNLSEDADGYATGIGLSVRGGTDISVTDSVFTNFMIGASFGNATDVSVMGNDLSEMRVDGLTFTKMNDLLISGNVIHDFARNLLAGDHSDMIQFWTNGNTEPMTNIRILDNILDIGEGNATQGIFIGNEALDQGYGSEMFYQNLEISGNTLVNGHLNGLYIGATDGLIVRENTLINPDEDASLIALPRIRIDSQSTDVLIDSNIVEEIWGENGQSDWQVLDNVNPDDADVTQAEVVSSDATVCRRLTLEEWQEADTAVAMAEAAEAFIDKRARNQFTDTKLSDCAIACKEEAPFTQDPHQFMNSLADDLCFL